MFTLRITLLITVIVPLNYDLCFCRSAHAEYEIDGQCCPMCAPGKTANKNLYHIVCISYTICFYAFFYYKCVKYNFSSGDFPTKKKKKLKMRKSIL